MSAAAMNELREFHRFLSKRITADENKLSPEEVLDEWRQLHPSTEAIEEDAAAIQKALDDMDNGDKGIPFDDFDHEFRTRHNIPA